MEPWVFAFFAIPLLLFAVFLRRAIRIGRLLRDPERLWSLLSEDTRSALIEAGLDPHSLSMREIQKSGELQRRVAADLSRALRAVLLGLPRPALGPSPEASRLSGPRELEPRRSPWSEPLSSRAGEPRLPAPTAPAPGPGLRVVLLLVFVALIAMAIFASGLKS